MLSALADAVDGILARSRHMETAWGAFLDSTLDRLSDQFYLAGFWILFWTRADVMAASAAIFSAALLSLLISYAKARAATLGVHCTAGLMDRGVRTLALIGWALLLGFFPAWRGTILWSGLLLYNLLVLLTFIQRLVEIRTILQRNSPPGDPAEHLPPTPG
jgi:CDP-diacylglycerol--glycerol-3-phosphate 3-phosphatidyltransferase